MVIVRGHFDGRQVVLDDPVPAEMPANTPVQVVFGPAQPSAALAEIARCALPGGLPPDYAAQHEHYVKGTPRR